MIIPVTLQLLKLAVSNPTGHLGILLFYSILSDSLIEIFIARITTSALQTEFYIYSHDTFWNWRDNRKMGHWPHWMHCETQQRCNLSPDLHKLVDHVSMVAFRAFEDYYQFRAKTQQLLGTVGSFLVICLDQILMITILCSITKKLHHLNLCRKCRKLYLITVQQIFDSSMHFLFSTICSSSKQCI